ncbi:MAG: long-chain fatty acid--CoA ligase, partial [Rhodospirillales bacterium]|nr:long-chain fatty acid--CoA ligase [Rhodospirillales bacterium]
PTILGRRAIGTVDRLRYAAGDLVIYGPLRDVLGMSRIRVAYTTGDAIDPEVLTFFRAIGINLKQVYGTTETGFFVAVQRDGAVASDHVARRWPGSNSRSRPTARFWSARADCSGPISAIRQTGGRR